MKYRLVFGSVLVVLQIEHQFVQIWVHLVIYIDLLGVEQSQFLIYLLQR
jgi:hypothetical protein